MHRLKPSRNPNNHEGSIKLLAALCNSNAIRPNRALGEEIAISTRMNSFVQKIFDLHNLRQAAATMVFNQDDYLLGTAL